MKYLHQIAHSYDACLLNSSSFCFNEVEQQATGFAENILKTMSNIRFSAIVRDNLCGYHRQVVLNEIDSST